MNKQKEYEFLVEDVRHCVECDKYTNKYRTEIVKLEHDKKRRHINLWAEWQGSLDADILLIGQDWGRLGGDLISKKEGTLTGEVFARELEQMIDKGTTYLDCWGRNSKAFL